ncbi:MAG: hypothetical protein F4X57_10825 [Chloroflexi bacterium]|nr:hypothetical protein [Chloroflexota bacterium]
MAVQKLGKLELMDVRKVWPNEAQDFTPWLARNLTLLGDALQIDLKLERTEAQVGAFSLDILATDGNGVGVAIENQLGTTDHTHLGQLLTYAAGYKVRTLIWVTPSFRDEHRKTLEWLNSWAPDEIEVYGVEVRAVRIGDSLPAPEFVPVVFPNERRPSLQGPDAPNRKEFYQPLVNRLREEDFTTKQNATSAWIQRFESNVPGLTYNADVGSNPRVFMSMSDRNTKQQVFDSLREDAERVKRVENALGIQDDPSTEIIWKTAPGNISVSRKGSGNNMTDEVRDWMFNYLIKFKKVFNPHIEAIVNNLPTIPSGDE